MKLTSKIKATCVALIAVVTAISVFIVCSVFVHREKIDSKYDSFIAAEAFRNITIKDCNGVSLFNGEFSESEELRCSTFHIIGDCYGSVPESLLSTEARDMKQTSTLTGYDAPEKNIILTIDSFLQKKAYSLLVSEGYKGCIIVSDYTTGEIKVMTSTPSVDVSERSYAPQDSAYLNKALYAYAPGSVFKSAAVVAAVEKDANARRFLFTCDSTYSQNVSCYQKRQHGTIGIDGILKNSCNCGTAALVQKYLTPQEFNSFLNVFGLADPEICTVGINAKKGYLNAEDDMLWCANGQSTNLVTPLSITYFYNAIANGGIAKPLFMNVKQAASDSRRIMSSATADFVAEALKGVTESSGILCETFGKTGTAELAGNEPHSWFTCCIAQDGMPAYTVTVFLENGGISTNAKNIAVEYINSYILG